mmetsp:Transcript_143781/g.400761  ORF Transcript_143781/g.400761 Transcript_143781/m.400761 type:complete len:179 (-) Transcript_143781:60-596(-)
MLTASGLAAVAVKASSVGGGTVAASAALAPSAVDHVHLVTNAMANSGDQAMAANMATIVDQAHGINSDEVQALYNEARDRVLDMRGALIDAGATPEELYSYVAAKGPVSVGPESAVVDAALSGTAPAVESAPAVHAASVGYLSGAFQLLQGFLEHNLGIKPETGRNRRCCSIGLTTMS